VPALFGLFSRRFGAVTSRAQGLQVRRVIGAALNPRDDVMGAE